MNKNLLNPSKGFEGQLGYLDNLTSKLAEEKYKQIEEFAAAFMKKVNLNPEDIVMFQGIKYANGKMVQKTFFSKKNNEEVKIIEQLREENIALQKSLDMLIIRGRQTK